MKKFNDYLVRIWESQGDLEFDAVVALRICADCKDKEEVIEQYARNFRDVLTSWKILATEATPVQAGWWFASRRRRR